MYKIHRSFLTAAMAAVLMVVTACANSSEPPPEPAKQNQNQNQNQEQQTPEEQTQEDQAPEVAEDKPQDQEEPVEGQPPTVKEAATTVIRALKAGNMETVAQWAHLEKGVRFSPYAYVDKETDVVLSQEELEGIMDDSKKRVWRTYAGRGDKIEMTYAEYHKEFVYDMDYMEKAEVAVNEVLGEGTTVNNLDEVYPPDNHDYVSYYIDGVNPEYEGMDWGSLRLVFEEIGSDYALVGIIHDEWTP
ncbi:hypothetical protein DNH61_01280 [Paenibacillus sambharensis]|uniref:PepSY domain-containing protein n=1 Tax=Paenibacillus sambharensis TaxID=1803190 RepID=A0A2W1LBB7_9BACL|nr:hypothetical protein [Paenibacillus sambharensis]PZD97538.1 hypothetical protein DNH61_01280 [Paenibacillus sambharensis]